MDQRDSDRRTVLLHFNRRGESQGDGAFVAWPPAEVTLADVTIEEGMLNIELDLLDRYLTFHGSFQIPVAHVTDAYATADGLVIETRGDAFPRITIQLPDGKDPAVLAYDIVRAAHGAT